MAMKRYAGVEIKKVLKSEDERFLTSCKSCGCKFDSRETTTCPVCKTGA